MSDIFIPTNPEPDPSDLVSSDDRHVAIRAALTVCEINASQGEVTSFEDVTDGILQIYNFLNMNKNEQD